MFNHRPGQSKSIISTFKDVKIETEKCLHLKTNTRPVIVGALGMIKKETDKHINKILESPSLCEIQKIALCKNAYLHRRILLI